MADKEISGLTAATTPLAGTELVHIDQGGNSRKVALTDVVAIATGAMLKATYDPNDDGVIAVAQGGTGGATASAARTNLGLGTMAVQNAASVSISGGTVTGITDLTVADGGTGASDASGARTNLGLVIGTDVQAYSANLAGFAATTVANVQNRVNHTGTQLAATISDFSTAADARVSAAIGSTVQAYSANLDGWSAITAASKLDANVIPDAEDGKILSWTGTSLVNKTAGELGVLVVGEDVQAWSANLDSWSALATSAKQDASANLTTLAALDESYMQDYRVGDYADLLRPIPKAFNRPRVIREPGSQYVALPFSHDFGNGRRVVIYSDGDAHGDSDRQIMLRTDDGFLTWESVTFIENSTGIFDFSLIEDLMEVGDIVTLKAWTIIKGDDGCFAYTASTISAFTNTLLHSDDHDNAAWTKSGFDAFGAGSVANTTAVRDPMGGQTANFLRPTTDSGADTVQQTVTGHSPNQTSVFSQWVKFQPGGPSWVRLFMLDASATGNSVSGYFDIANGVVGTATNSGNGSGATVTMTEGLDGWWLCKLSGKPNTSGSNTLCIIRPTSSGGSNSYTGNGTNGFYLWRGQLETGSTAHQPALKTTTASVGSAVPGGNTYAYWSRVKEFDGAHYRTGYTTTPSDWISALFKSTDGGYSWLWHATLASDTGKDFNEADIEQLDSGDFIAVIREDTGADRPLYVNTSVGDDNSWGATPTRIDPDGTQPNLTKLMNGKILLAAGGRTGASGLNSAGDPVGTYQDIRVGCLVSIADADGTGWTTQRNIGLSYGTDCGQPCPDLEDDGSVTAVMYLTPNSTSEPGIYAVNFSPGNLSVAATSDNLATLAGVTPGSKGLAILADTTSDAVHEELAKDWSGGTSGAPTLSVPNIMQRRYVDIGAYCSLTDTNSARAGIVAAFAAGVEGREFVFTNPFGGTRYYRVPDRAGGRIFLPEAKTFRLICEPGAVVDFSDFGNGTGLTSSAYFYGTGSVGTEHALTATANIDTNTVTVSAADSANYAVGDDIFVRSGGLFTTEESTIGTQGEWASVIGVNTTTGVLTLGAKLRATYNASPHADAAYITKVTPISGSVENLNIIGAGRFADNTSGDRGLQVVNAKNFKVLGGNFRYCDFNQIAFVNVLNGLVDGTRIEFEGKGSTTGLQYGVGFNNMCENTWGRNCDVNGGSEGLVLSSTGQPQGVMRDVGFESCRVRGSSRSGACTHDNHENWYVINCTFEDCEQGIDHRINGLVATGNTFRRMGAYSGSLSCALQLGSGAGKVLFAGNVLEDMVRGVWHANTVIDETQTGAVGDIMISGNVMRGITNHGVLFNVESTDDTTARGAIQVIGNDISMATSGTAPLGVEIEGKWNKPVVAQNTFRGGNGGRAVYLHNTSAGGTDGPISPSIVGNRYENYTEPLIQHSTGKWTIEGNVDIDATALPSLASASALTIPTTGNVYSVTGTTTINTILRAAEYVGKTIILMFSASLTVTNNANAGAANDIQLSGAANFAATANDQLMLVSNGTVWREVSRTAI